MSRRFPNFIDAYLEYSDNSFVPKQFNTWGALSIIAGALARRTWLPWDDNYSFYPNIYVMFVSLPGGAKSVALNRAVDLLLETQRRGLKLNVMPNQVTEAKFIELMGHGTTFEEHAGDKVLLHNQNAAYYFASEASNSLRNVFGDFLACLTDFYDCPKTWERATKKDGKKISLTNVCVNLLAGSTFDYLGKIVNDENIMGGFASRLIYVVSKNKKVVAQQFQLGGMDEKLTEERRVFREALIDDLSQIGTMTGAFTATREFAAAWEKWFPEYERYRQEMSSPKAQAILARTNTNILKTAMLLSAAESNNRILDIQHWTRAHDMIMAIQAETMGVLRMARADSSDKSPSNLASAVLTQVERSPGIKRETVQARLTAMGYASIAVGNVIHSLEVAGALRRDVTGGLEILGNPDNYL